VVQAIFVACQGFSVTGGAFSITKDMLVSTSKVVWIVAVAYLATFFALASGMINAIIEGKGINRFFLPSRSVQTVGETVVITLILFIGMAGTFMLYHSGRSPNPKVQKALLIAGFGMLGIALLLGFIIVQVKLR
jgi:hypothetical protein